jgi:hypothetical protein
MLLFGWFIPIRRGVVLSKSHYSARGIQRETFQATELDKGRQQVIVYTTTMPQQEAWSFTIADSIHHRTGEVYVYEMQFNNTKVGDAFIGVDNRK